MSSLLDTYHGIVGEVYRLRAALEAAERERDQAQEGWDLFAARMHGAEARADALKEQVEAATKLLGLAKYRAAWLGGGWEAKCDEWFAALARLDQRETE